MKFRISIESGTHRYQSKFAIPDEAAAQAELVSELTEIQKQFVRKGEARPPTSRSGPLARRRRAREVRSDARPRRLCTFAVVPGLRPGGYCTPRSHAPAAARRRGVRSSL